MSSDSQVLLNAGPLNLEPLNLEPLNLEPLNMEPLNTCRVRHWGGIRGFMTPLISYVKSCVYVHFARVCHFSRFLKRVLKSSRLHQGLAKWKDGN